MSRKSEFRGCVVIIAWFASLFWCAVSCNKMYCHVYTKTPPASDKVMVRRLR